MSITQGRSSGGNHSSLTKRVADMERLLSRFSPQRMRLADSTGKMGIYMVLVARNGTADGESTGAPFSLLSKKKSGASYIVTIAPGWVRDIITVEGDGIKFHMPKAGSVELSNDPAPEITMNPGEKLYCKYTTTSTGTVDEGSASIVTSKKDEKTKHYEPKDASGAGGLNGEYWVKIGELQKGPSNTAIWKQYQNSDIEHYHELTTFKNMGDGSGVLKRWNAGSDWYEARKVKALFGITDDEEDERIALNLDVENVGDGQQLVVVPEKGSNKGSDESMKIRSIRAAKAEDISGGGGSPQIKVEKKENVLVVKGNEKKGSLVLSDCDDKEVIRLEWEDGLITTAGNLAGILGDCSDDRSSGSDTPPPP